jgi:hypothetical protein
MSINRVMHYIIGALEGTPRPKREQLRRRIMQQLAALDLLNIPERESEREPAQTPPAPVAPKLLRFARAALKQTGADYPIEAIKLARAMVPGTSVKEEKAAVAAAAMKQKTARRP